MRSNLVPLAVGGHSEGHSQGGPQGGPTGPAGWGMSRPAHRNPRTLLPTHPGPARARSLRSLVGGCSSQQSGLAGWVPGIPSPTHPLYPSPAPTRYPPTVSAGHAQYGRTSKNSTFWDIVGEPRGSRTQPYIGSQAGYIQLFINNEVYTAV